MSGRFGDPPSAKLLSGPRALGRPGYFGWEALRGVLTGRVSPYWREVIRQAYRLAISTGSVVLILGLSLSFGLWVGVQGAYGAQLVGAPAAAGAFTSIGNLREVVPYAFAYMVAAKVATGYVAEIGTMRIEEEIDALGVMGVAPLPYLIGTRLVAAWIVLPFVYALSIIVAFLASFAVVVGQIGQVSAGGYLELFWKFQNPTDYLYSGLKGLSMASFAVMVGCYFGYTVRGGPVEVGFATAKSMVVNLIGIHFIGIVASQLFWGGNPNLPIGG